MKYAFLFLLVSSAFAVEKKASIVVGAQIVYNCQSIDEKNKKYCEKVDIRKESDYIVIRY